VLEGRAAKLAQALEEALVENPDDLATHAAYADLMSEHGDPRGEFIQVQLALEDESLPKRDRSKLKKREQELLEAHQREWLGELGPFCLGEIKHEPEYEAPIARAFAFRRGWLDSLDFRNLTVPLARALRSAPEGRLLRELRIQSAGDYSGDYEPEDGKPERELSDARGLCPLVTADFLTNVRVFHLGEDQGDDYQKYNCYMHTTKAVEVIRRMPRLEELRLFANGFDVNAIFRLKTLTELRVLQLYHCRRVYRLQLLAKNSAFANLTHLLIHPHHIGAWWHNGVNDEAAGYRREDGFLPLSDIRPLLRSKHLRKLTHLQLRCSTLGDTGCEEIVASGILERLTWLDLRHGCITDEGARTLAECSAVKNLEWLDLDRNALSPDGIALIQSLGIPCRCEDQQTEAELNQDWEPQYLCEGEFE
jgi:uncharacterized protein (TIGR02996 family)